MPRRSRELGARAQQNQDAAALAEGDDETLPRVLYVRDFAALLRISPKALRHRVARGQVPAPFRMGRALAWTREAVTRWLRDCDRGVASVPVKMTLRPYANDRARWHVDLRYQDPRDEGRERRKRIVAPKGMSEAEAMRRKGPPVNSCYALAEDSPVVLAMRAEAEAAAD